MARAPSIAIACCGILLIAASNNINWGGEHWRTVLQADARGYHAYLPALLIHGDINFGFFDEMEREKYHNPDIFYDYRTAPTGRTINKYFVGTALCEAPFFLAAHAWVNATGGDADGYAKPYVVAINLAAIAYVLLGLLALDALLVRYGIDARWRAVMPVALVFGTNLFYYSVVAPGMSHAYSFGLCALFLLLGCQAIETQRGRHLIALGALLGLIVLVRPVNGLVVLMLPVFAGGWVPFVAWMKSLWRAIGCALAGALACVAIAAIQLLIYEQSTGHWWVDSYAEEGFNWTDPHGLDMLFSYRKGLFVYTPLLLLSLVGMPYLWRRERSSAIAWAMCFVVITYVLSSWWNWWYGGSFGQRVWVEYLALFALPLALALQHLTKGWRILYLVLVAGLLVLCQFQTYQARYFVIHWEDMTREKYWKVFLQL